MEDPWAVVEDGVIGGLFTLVVVGYDGGSSSGEVMV
jgi:hypothetical protein